MANTYKCALCGRTYGTVNERTKCEMRCYEDIRKAEELEAKKKLAEERSRDREEIDKDLEDLVKKVEAYSKKYGLNDEWKTIFEPFFPGFLFQF